MAASRALAATGAALLLVALSACTSEPEAPQEPAGPSGFELAGMQGDVEVWYDRGEQSGITDVLLMQDGRRVGACLGDAGLVCVQGDVSQVPYVILISPPNATRAELVWFGTPMEMTSTNETVAADAPHVFVAAPPAGDPAAYSMHINVFDAAGAPIAQY